MSDLGSRRLEAPRVGRGWSCRLGSTWCPGPHSLCVHTTTLGGSDPLTNNVSLQCRWRLGTSPLHTPRPRLSWGLTYPSSLDLLYRPTILSGRVGVLSRMGDVGVGPIHPTVTYRGLGLSPPSPVGLLTSPRRACRLRTTTSDPSKQPHWSSVVPQK